MRAGDLPRIARAVLEHVAALATGTYRRSVGAAAIVRDGDGLVLVVRTGYRRGWSLPGGHVARRERLEGGLAREIREETGLDVRVGRLLAVDVREPGSVVFVFGARLHGGSIDPAPLEIRAVRWIAEADLEALLELDRSRARAAAAAERDGSVAYLAAPTIGA